MTSSSNVSNQCCTLRCTVEKRSMCRDLQKWSKTLLFMIGLENVADRIAGRRKFHRRHGHQLQTDTLRISPPPSTTKLHSNDPSTHQPTFDAEEHMALPQDWDPKERCRICTQATEKEEATKKASQLQHSRTKKDIRTEKCKDADNKSRNSDTTATSASSVNSQQHLNKQQLQSNNLSQSMDWRSMNGMTSFNPMSMFRTGQSPSTQYASTSAASLAAAMFTPTVYPFHDINQVYFEFMNQYKAMAATMAASGANSFNMLSPLSFSSPSLSSYPGISFQQLVANLGVGTSGTSLNLESAFNIDQPLDLTKKSASSKKLDQGVPSSNVGEKASTTSLSSTNAISSQSPAGKGSNTSPNGSSSSNANKRGYTQADLQAALEDIRSKKLGTRKASLVYNVPRSTLRNKIYKLGVLDEDHSQSTAIALVLGESCSSPASIKSGNSNSRNRKTNKTKKILETKEKSKIKETSLSPLEDVACETAITSSEDSTASLSSSSSVSSCANETNSLNYSSSYNTSWTASAESLTAELAKRQAFETLLRTTSTNRASGSDFGNDTASYVSTVMNGRPAVKAVLQEAVSNALVENLKLKCGSSITSPDTNSSPIIKSNSSTKRSSRRRGGTEKSPATMVKIERPSSVGDCSSNAEDIGDLSKKVRPKRGQYRKYDKEALAAAVHAVRRGEMSVHRAGSHFGVPHSTLEYKVKERNLLRIKKRDLKKKLEEEAAASKMAPVDASMDEETPVAAIATPETTTNEKKSIPKSNRSTKSKRKSTDNGTPASRVGSPLSNEVFNSLVASVSSSLELSALASAPPSKKKRPIETTAATVSSSSSSPSSSTKLQIVTDMNSDVNASNGDEHQSGYSTLQASYEAGFQAALMASGLHQIPLWQQSLASSNDALDLDANKECEDQKST